MVCVCHSWSEGSFQSPLRTLTSHPPPRLSHSPVDPHRCNTMRLQPGHIPPLIFPSSHNFTPASLTSLLASAGQIWRPQLIGGDRLSTARNSLSLFLSSFAVCLTTVQKGGWWGGGLWRAFQPIVKKHRQRESLQHCANVLAALHVLHLTWYYNND